MGKIEQRMDYFSVDPKAMKGLMEIEKYVAQSSLSKTIFELVKYRASQINGCAYCMDMHTKDALHEGETDQRLFVLSGWRDAPFYTDKERAALEWTEALTEISKNHITDDLYERVSQYFDEKELLALTMTIIGINGWNRLAIPFRSHVGDYQPGQR
ncbi:MAG: carboxymuconolactone decarboxylase family protein [Chitinophagales bacterium]|nr:carboxymuconolactone decarboxylase family protein [Chitinophagales bacterium]